MLLSRQKVSEKLIIPASKRLYLYNFGNECTDITGGWVIGHSAGSGQQSKETAYLLTQTNQSSPASYRIYVTDQRIDFTNLLKLKASLSFANSTAPDGSGVFVRVGDIKNDGNGEIASYEDTVDTQGQAVEVEIDVSEVTGAYYIKVGCWSSYTAGTQGTARFYGIWGEK